MADAFSKLRNFLYDMARRRKREGLWDKKHDQPSPVAIAKLTQIDIGTVQRILAGTRKTVPGDDRQRPVREYRMTVEVAEKLMASFGFRSLGDLEDELDHSPPAPDWRPMRRPRNS